MRRLGEQKPAQGVIGKSVSPYGKPILAAVQTMFCLLLVTPGLFAQDSKPTEYQVKTAYLYNFAHFVAWPPSAENKDTFAICVLGQDPFGSTLDNTLAGEVIDSRKAAAKRISEPKDATSCNVLFISSSEESRLGATLAALDGAPVLTVSDIPKFSQRGGMIQFVLDGNKVRFEVNLTAAQTAGLNLSSQLLKVATVVRRNTRHGD
jgi:hypothetical protein